MFPMVHGIYSQGGEPAPYVPIAVPIANATNPGGWTEFAGDGDGHWWDELDETTAAHDGDATAWVSPASTGTKSFYMDLKPVTDPGVHTGHVIRVACRLADDAAGGIVAVRILLFQLPGTQIITGNFVEVTSEDYTTLEWPLSEVQAGNITDYSVLRLGIDSTTTTGERQVIVTAAELEVPEVE